MNLRRRRRARTLALTAFLLAALVWAFSVLFAMSWGSRVHAWPSDPISILLADPPMYRHYASLGEGVFIASNRAGGAEGWRFGPARSLHQYWLPPTGLNFVDVASNPIGPSTTRIFVLVPLWIPLALTLPPLLLTHARVRRPLARLRRGLCHRCAYDLASTPPNHPCPECGTPRLSLPPRPGRPARTPT